MNSIVTVVHVTDKLTSHNGLRKASLDMLIDFKHHKVGGEVALTFGGETKRIQCDSFISAQTMYGIAEEWLEGFRDDMFNWDRDDEDGEAGEE